MKTLFALLLLVTLTACGDQYRYPCQNPANWNEDYCKKPQCDVSRTCPEHIFKGAEITRLLPAGAAVPDSLKADTPAAAPPRRAPPPPPSGSCK